MKDIDQELVHMARLAAQGRTPEMFTVARRALRQLVQRRPDLAQVASEVLQSLRDEKVTRSAALPLPVDVDSRLELLRRETVGDLSVEPVWPHDVAVELDAVVEERARESELEGAGLNPTRSMLFVGLPGTGKTLAARWLARRLGRQLLTLDLAAVMSSFLGRTGNNIRVVLDYSKQSPGVLLLDEFDAIAKRRDDAVEVGELKRLVTVLLQAVDDWPADGLLLAATNHPELLDPAVWRRFERVVQFPLPARADVEAIIESLTAANGLRPGDEVLSMLALVMEGKSGADVVRTVTSARREAVIKRRELGEVLVDTAAQLARQGSLSVRKELAARMRASGVSQRRVSQLTGLSRDTVRKHETNERPGAAKRRDTHGA